MADTGSEKATADGEILSRCRSESGRDSCGLRAGHAGWHKGATTKKRARCSSWERPRWEVFCRHISVGGLPECVLPMGHKGAHITAYVEPGELLARCAIMLKGQ